DSCGSKRVDRSGYVTRRLTPPARQFIAPNTGLQEAATADAAAAEAAATNAALACPLLSALSGHEVKRIDFGDLLKIRQGRDAHVATIGRNDGVVGVRGTRRNLRDHRAIPNGAAKEEAGHKPHLAS